LSTFRHTKKARAALILDFFHTGRERLAAGPGKVPIHQGSTAASGFYDVAAPHCGHIPPPFFAYSVGAVAKGMSGSIT
jgi:hypothetical protein